MKKKLAFLSAGLTLLSCNSNQKQTDQEKGKTPKKPNILLIVIDDLGWTDLECYGSDLHETPNINKLAKEGVRFTNAYATCPVCSPTRASIMTGKYPTTVNITDYIKGKQHAQGILPKHKFIVPEFNFQLPHSEITIAEKLKTIGYQTMFIGKWHLGDTGYFPTDQGFDINIAGHHAGMPPSYYYPYCKGVNKWAKDARKGEKWCLEMLDVSKDKDSLYLTDRLTNEAIHLIKENKDGPFFMYLPFYSVHTPIEARPDLRHYYKKKLDTVNAKIHDWEEYAAMVHCVDESIGKVIQTLENNRLTDNTVIIVTSDNGGLKARGSITNNYPLRAGKGTAYEGGIRIPAIFKWNGHFQQGMTSDEMIISNDIFPTIMDVVGLEDKTSEGESLLPLLTKLEPLKRKTLYWHYPHYHLTKPVGAIRNENYKLLEYFETGKLELYNLKNDLSEMNDLSAEMPEKVNELHSLLKEWRKKTGAKMPTRNPDWDSTKVYKTQLDENLFAD